MGIASLVVGIIGLIVSIIPFFGEYALPLTVIALLLGALGRRTTPNGLATAGLVLGLIGTSLAGYWVYASHKAADALHDEWAKPMTPPPR